MIFISISQNRRLFDGNETLALITDKAALEAGITHTEVVHSTESSESSSEDVKKVDPGLAWPVNFWLLSSYCDCHATD